MLKRVYLVQLRVAFTLLVIMAGTSPVVLGGEQQADGETNEYRLGPGDRIDVKVFQLEELSQEVPVSNSGKIHLPYLGVVRVMGKTPTELEKELAKQLVEKELVKDPQVQVMVTLFRARPFYILGEVDMPGQYVITDETFLLDAYTMSGGASFHAGRWGYLYRRNFSDSVTDEDVPPMPAFEIIKVDLKELVEGKSPELNVAVRGGDFLYVPQKKPRFFFVVGDVVSAGGFELPESGLLLASQALAQAGGPTKTAKANRGMLVRFAEDGSRQELAVDFDGILKGRKPDFQVLDNDVIFIPGSTAKTLGYSMLGVIPGMAQTAILASRPR